MATRRKVLLAASMNGGAEAIIPLIEALKAKGLEVHVLSYKAATSTFKDRGVLFEEVQGKPSLECCRRKIAEFGPGCIVTGTQTQDAEQPLTFEQMLWQAGKEARVSTIAVMDTYDTYLARFSDLNLAAKSPILSIRAKLSRMPHKIAIMDAYARQEMLGLGFPESVLAVTGNPHFEHTVREAAKLAPDTRAHLLTKPVFKQFYGFGRTVVFMSDSIEGYYPNIGFTEKSMLQMFLAAAEGVARQACVQINVIVRPHPVRDQNARDAFKEASEKLRLLRVVLHNPTKTRESDPLNYYTMEALLYSATAVVGTFNNPLVTAALMGKPVIQFLPGITPGHEFQVFLSEQDYAVRITKEEDLAKALRSVLEGKTIQKPFEAAQDAIDRVVELVRRMMLAQH